MPVFHTKTIEGILEPVAQQVSRLVILHEEAEDGNAMPDLEKPVMAVSRAVVNLVKVGKETINCSDDPILKQDMPAALLRVESASRLLEEASALLKSDPYSQPARKKLIEGARGILQGTSSLLLCFDESEVRKIIRDCKKVLDYLAVAEVIETMEDLVQFVKDLSPCLTKVSRDVDTRQQELTHQVHREILVRCLDAVKNLSPILICSMKIFIQIFNQGGKGYSEAAENRNYLAGRMTDEISEIIRVLQLTTYDEVEWDADNLTVMKKALNAIESRTATAHDWLLDHSALRGGIGEKSIRQILDQTLRIADRSLPSDKESLKKLTGDVNAMTDALCELRQDGRGALPQGQGMSRSIGEKLRELTGAAARAVNNVERSGIQQPAHTVAGRLEQAQNWLNNPQIDDKGLGQQAIGLIVDEGKKVASCLSGPAQYEISKLCDEVDDHSRQLSDLCRRGQGNSPQAQNIAKNLATKLHDLKTKIQKAVVDRVVEDFVDISTPLKQFTEAVLQLEGTPGRENNFEDKAYNLSNFSNRAAKTARMVAAGTTGGNKKMAQSLIASASQVESLTPQLVSAGRIRMTYPTNKSADEHFDNLRKQYAENIQKVRDMSDALTDPAAFFKASEQMMRRHTDACDTAINHGESQAIVDRASAIARLANRVIQVAKQEAENSEDPNFVRKINQSISRLQNAVAPMVSCAKDVAINPNDQLAASKWRQANKAVLECVCDVREVLSADSPHEDIFDNQFDRFNLSAMPPRPPPQPESNILDDDIFKMDFNKIFDNTDSIVHKKIGRKDDAPPRPPLPDGNRVPPRPPPPPETDDEEETILFKQAPTPSQPIMMAAHGLHQELKQWSSRDNEIISAAKKMALLMAQLSQLVRGEGGTKRDLIACAKSIAESSDEVTRLAKELAWECTDKRMRTNLLQVCERIPTIATQLKILSTVKATMLGAQGSEEDEEATEMLVGNAQNLMQSVKETVRAAEAASIKIRTDAGIKLRWVRKQPWYQY